MVSTELLYFLPVALGITLILIGMQKKEHYTGMFGALIIFGTGVSILITPTTLPSLLNDFLGTILWGLGAYMLIRSSVEESGG